MNFEACFQKTQNIKHKQYHKLMWVRPGELGEALNGIKAIVSKLPFVNHIGSFLSTLRDYQFTTEPICRCSQLCQLELLECRHAIVLLQFLLSSSTICFKYIHNNNTQNTNIKS
ncbi:hypothetical protein ACJW30_04G128000 [Castanea mollissima]